MKSWSRAGWCKGSARTHRGVESGLAVEVGEVVVVKSDGCVCGQKGAHCLNFLASYSTGKEGNDCMFAFRVAGFNGEGGRKNNCTWYENRERERLNTDFTATAVRGETTGWRVQDDFWERRCDRGLLETGRHFPPGNKSKKRRRYTCMCNGAKGEQLCNWLWYWKTEIW